MHIIMSDEGADINRKFFKNISAEYLMAKIKHMEKHNRDMFCRFIYMGKALIDYCTEGDLKNFKRLFADSDDKEIMYWHMQKCFKAAMKARKLNMVEFIIEELDMPLNHEAFDGYLHTFIFMCQGAEMSKDDLQKEIDRQLLRYLVTGFGRDGLNPIEKATGNTPLITACKLLKDPIIIETLVDHGADVNAVNI